MGRTELDPSVRHAHIAFRLDAANDIGFGHLMRCLSLADSLVSTGAACTFLVGGCSDPAQDLISGRGHTPIKLPALGERRAGWSRTGARHDADDTCSFATEHGVDWVVVDHYGLDASWEQIVRKNVAPVLTIDDLANRVHQCDILLDQTYKRRADDYRGLVEPWSRLLLGTKYALLAPQFARMRADALAARELRKGRVARILVSFGATDPWNLTEFALEALNESTFNGHVDVVLGETAPHLERVHARAATESNVSLHVGVRSMAEFMHIADLAIGAGGTTSWERCSLGLPTIVVQAADNQKEIIRVLAQAGAVVPVKIGYSASGQATRPYETLGDHRSEIAELAATIDSITNDPERIIRMSSVAARICDGCGASRVAAYLLPEARLKA